MATVKQQATMDGSLMRLVNHKHAEIWTILDAVGSPLTPQTPNWNALTNTPDISTTTTTGFFWIVGTAGATNLGGINDWKINDWAVKVSGGWAKIDNQTGAVISDVLWDGSNWTSTAAGATQHALQHAFAGFAAVAQTMYIGSTQVAINRASAALSLTGVDIDGTAAKATNMVGGVLGTMYAQSAADTSAAVAPNTTTTKNVLTMTGDGAGHGAAPVWGTLAYGDVGAAAVNQTMYIGSTQVAINRGSAALVMTGITSIDGTAAKATNIVGLGTLTHLGRVPYQSALDTTSWVEPNLTVTKKYLALTGDGTNGGVPVWDAITVPVPGSVAKNYNSDGTVGDINYNGGYVYLCVTTGTAGAGRWVRYVVETSAF